MKMDSLLSAVASYLAAEEYAGESSAQREERTHLRKHVEAVKNSLESGSAPCIEHVGATFRRIAVPVDGSLPAKWAAEVAARLAIDLGARLALVHAIRAASGRASDAAAEPLDLLHRRAADLLRTVEAVIPRGLRVEKLVVAGEEPKSEIVRAALDWGADLIVIGTHGRGRFSSFILGSTAAAVIRRAACPVLTIAHDPIALRKVKELLDGHHVRYVSIVHSPAYTAQEIAHAAHVSGHELAKTTMVKLDGEPAMIVVPSSQRVDLDRVREVAGADRAELATEAEFRGLFPDCEPGAMPPFGNLYGLRVFLSEELAQPEGHIAFNAGSHTELIRMNYADYEKFVHPIVAPLTGVPAHSLTTKGDVI